MASPTRWLTAILLSLSGLACAYHGNDFVAARQTSDRNGHWRPQVHFSPPQGFMNDPNGLFQDSKGTWHLYYQYADSCSNPSAKNWGHATSPDLYSWVDQPLAIAASSSWGQIYSGSTVVDQDNLSGLFPTAGRAGLDNVVAFFTSHTDSRESQFVVYSLDGGRTFQGYDHNPIVDLRRGNFRDPKVVYHKETKKYVMVTTLLDAVTFYTSPDLLTWTRASTWTPSPGLGMIECPQLIRIPRRKSATDTTLIGTAWVLVLSTAGGGANGASAVKYIVGDFDGTTFTPRGVPTHGSGQGYTVRLFDFGPDVYATAFFHFQTQAYVDGTQDAVSMSWAVNLAYGVGTPTCSDGGWRNAQTAARMHWLDESDNLVAVPQDPGAARQTAAIVYNQRGVDSAKVDYAQLAAASNPALEFFLTIYPPPALGPGQHASASLAFSSGQTGEAVALLVDVSAGELNFTMTRAGMRGFNNNGWNAFSATLPPLPGEKQYSVHGLLDRSMLEVYLNGGAAFGTMLYFADGLIDGAELKQTAGTELKFDLRILPLKSSWGNGP